jgi:hypothetical protein
MEIPTIVEEEIKAKGIKKPIFNNRVAEKLPKL